MQWLDKYVTTLSAIHSYGDIILFQLRQIFPTFNLACELHHVIANVGEACLFFHRVFHTSVTSNIINVTNFTVRSKRKYDSKNSTFHASYRYKMSNCFIIYMTWHGITWHEII